jgi:predicted transcriptional regulator
VSKKARARIVADGARGFFGRAREHARKLDRGEDLAPEVTISFEDPADMMRVLSVQRIRLLKVARRKPAAVTELAQDLKRDARAVSRDVDLLEKFALVHSRYEKNPGHGRRRIVSSRSTKYQLVANI